MWKSLGHKALEALISVLPITVLVAIFGFSMSGIANGIVWHFLLGAVFIVVGMALFTLGADVAMMPMGESVGSLLSKTKKKRLPVVLLVCFIIGLVITLAEPDLLILANQLGSKGETNWTILISVAVGVGIFLAASFLRTFFRIKLRYLLIGFYALVFALGLALQFVSPNYLAVAFDSGGVTTGPVTVPFLMALGIGLASIRGSKSRGEDSFGMIALCSVGPIIMVMLMGLIGGGVPDATPEMRPVLSTFSEMLTEYGHGLLDYALEVLLALAPVVAVFFIFQFAALRLSRGKIYKILIGVGYTFLGLTVFMTGVNVGFLPMGTALGAAIANTSWAAVIIPLGFVMGCFIVLAEPAVHVLTKQVEEITGGAVSRKKMLVALAVGVAVCIALAMLRVYFGISIWAFLVPVYVVSLALMFFVPPVFTGIAFDSGGVASGPMTATFLLPFAIGASHAFGNGDPNYVLNDAYGLIAYVAMAPLFTVQLIGALYKVKTLRHGKRVAAFIAAGQGVSDEPVEFELDKSVGETVVHDDALDENQTEKT